MSCEFYIRESMQLIELKISKVNDENRHLINALDRSLLQPLLRIFFKSPFPK